MKVPRWLWGRRLLAALAVATAAAAAAVAVTSGASARQQVQAAPVVDADYLYAELYGMAGAYSYRISGPTGRHRIRRTRSTSRRRSTAGRSSSRTGRAPVDEHCHQRSARRRRHGERSLLPALGRLPLRLQRRRGDDPRRDLPGPARAAGRASRRDARHRPTSSTRSTPARPAASPASAPRGARSPTATSATRAPTTASPASPCRMAEYKALLQWYAANGTYPKRTLKVALLDASRGKTPNGLFSREGSDVLREQPAPRRTAGQSYALLANMDSLGLDYPAYHLGTEFFLEQRHRWRRAAVVHVRQGHAGGGQLRVSRHGAVAGRRSRQLGRDRPAPHRPAGGDRRRLRPAGRQVRASRSRSRTRCATTRPGQAPNPYSGNVTDHAGVLGVRPGALLAGPRRQRRPRGRAGVLRQGHPGLHRLAASRTPTATRTRTPRRSAAPIKAHAGDRLRRQPDHVPDRQQHARGRHDDDRRPGSAGDTNVKVAAVTNLAVGNPIFIDTGANIEYGQIQSIGTAGATGTGVTLATPLKARARQRRAVQRQRGAAGRLHDRHDRAPELLRRRRTARPRRAASQPTEELKRALELPAQWTSMLLAGDDYLGATAAPTTPVAYFETEPGQPDVDARPSPSTRASPATTTAAPTA